VETHKKAGLYRRLHSWPQTLTQSRSRHPSSAWERKWHGSIGLGDGVIVVVAWGEGEYGQKTDGRALQDCVEKGVRQEMTTFSCHKGDGNTSFAYVDTMPAIMLVHCMTSICRARASRDRVLIVYARSRALFFAFWREDSSEIVPGGPW
jgi:hypothetical protein